MYYYILGCGIACLVLFGINSMDTVDVKPAEILSCGGSQGYVRSHWS